MVDHRIAPQSKTEWDSLHTTRDAPPEMPDRSRAKPPHLHAPEPKPVRRGREMIDLLVVEDPKPGRRRYERVVHEAAIDQLLKHTRSSRPRTHLWTPR